MATTMLKSAGEGEKRLWEKSPSPFPRAPIPHPPKLFGLVFFFCCLLSACAVGPDFAPPAPPPAERYTEAPLPETTAEADRRTIPPLPETAVPAKSPEQAPPGMADAEFHPSSGAAQRFAAGNLPRSWWDLFQSPKAAELVLLALGNNPGLDRAKAALDRASHLYRAEAGAVWSPAVNANLSAVRQQINPDAMGMPSLTQPPGMSGGDRPGPFTLYSAGLSVSYTLDIFGGNRRALEALDAEAEYRAFELEAARLALAANVMDCAIREAGLRELIRAAQSMIDARRQQAQTAGAQLRAGGLSPLEASVRRRELAEVSATLPPLERALAAERHRLAILLGYPPDHAALPAFSLADFTLPQELPLCLPADLVRRRPDVRAAESLLRKATAQAGVAAANLYPRLTLTGSAGYSATGDNDLFASSANVWSIGASLLQPVFRGGELLYRKKAAESALAEAEAAWRETVLRAYADVADALAALQSGANTLAATREAAREAQTARDIAAARYQAGGVSRMDLLDADRRRNQMRLAEIQAVMDRYAQTVMLFQALGGGASDAEDGASGGQGLRP